MNRDPDNGKDVDREAHVARESRERVATAWAELVVAARTDPKARAFLAAFGKLEEAEATGRIAVAEAVDRVHGPRGFSLPASDA
jgi:hypothetical protein